MARVLLVDDEAALLRAVSRNISSDGHEVTAVERGALALEIIEKQTFDIAIIDRKLPAMGGLEILQALRERQPECKRVLMSGYIDAPFVIRLVNETGVTRILEKPVEMQVLLDLVAELEGAPEPAPELSPYAEERAAFTEYLAGDFSKLALQPLIDCRDSKVVALEALIRSTHDVFKHPGLILGAAERLEMVHEVSCEVAKMASALVPLVREDIKLFVNIHPNELADAKSLCHALAPLDQYSDRVALEITERSSMLGLSHWQDSINALCDKGYNLAVDDLGAGYNSLAILAALQPQFIKIDMSIVRDVNTDSRKLRLIELLVHFAEATGARIVAEGVETEQEAEALRLCGVHILQGYYFGRPSLELDDNWR